MEIRHGSAVETLMFSSSSFFASYGWKTSRIRHSRANSTPFLRHGFFEVVNLHDAKLIGLNGGLQGRRCLTHGFAGG